MPGDGQDTNAQRRSSGLVGTHLTETISSLGQSLPALKRLVGLTAGLGAILIAVVNILVLVITHHRHFPQVMANSAVSLLILIGLVWIGSAFIRMSVAIWLQIPIFYFAALAAAISSNPGNVTSALFFLYTFVLLIEFDIEKRTLYVSIAILILTYIAALTYGYSRYTANWFPIALDSIILVSLFVMLYGLVLARHWMRHRRESELLETRVRERTADLERALDERVVMLQEIHHRVKNNLQIVASLLRLETNRLDEDDAARRPMETSIQRIHAMALVHETLYQSEGFRLVELRSYTGELLSAISGAIEASVRYDTRTEDEIEVSLDFAIPFGLLLNELVSNAEEHAYAPGENGTIAISLSCNSNVELVVEDNGVGLDNKGEPSVRKSLGLTLVHSLVKQLNGHIELESSSGTRWHAVFPMEAPRTPAVRSKSESE